AAGWSLGASQAGNFTHQLNRADKWIADYNLKAAVPVKALVTWDPAVQLKIGPGVVSVLKPLETIQSNVQLFHNYYQRRTGSTYFQQLDAAGAVVASVRRKRGVGDVFIIGNT